MKGFIVLCALAACAIALVATASTASASSVLMVDDDGAQCPNAEFTSIQAAVVAASPGDVVRVCPGAYEELVAVTKARLTVQAQRRPTLDCFANDPEQFDPTRDAIVSGGPGGTAFEISADGVRVVGFVIRGSGTGVHTPQTVSGFRIEQNVVTGNQFGVRSGSSGAELSRFFLNCFRDNGANGALVALPLPDTGVLNNARIDHNAFFRNSFGVRLGASQDVTVDHNTSFQDGTWMRNGGIVDSAVLDNRIGAGPLDGIDFIPLGGSGVPNANVVVSGNEISGRGRDGIQACGGQLAPPCAGSSLVDSLISDNAIASSGRDGIRIELGNGGNFVKHNVLDGNAAHDCHDDTVGAGTAGTANFWGQNAGETENRPGLCDGAAVTAAP